LIRVADFLKKADRKEKESRGITGEKSAAVSVKPEIPVPHLSQAALQKQRLNEDQITAKNEEVTEGAVISPVMITPVVMEKGRASDKEESANIYQETVAFTKEIYVQALNDEVLECTAIHNCVSNLVEQIITDNEHIVGLTTGPSEHYPYGHAVNVCILSMKIATGLGYDREQLKELGISAIVHDIGMVKFMDLAGQPRKLKKKEYREIRKHPLVSAQILETAKDVPDAAVSAVLQEHERVDGSGYPHGIKRGAITEYAQIISLADGFEAMTHPRPYRHVFTPYKAVQEIISMKDFYNYNIMKTFIDVIGVFPVGSHVRLNTGETGKVIRIHNGFPTRPVIKIMYERDGRKSDETKIKDLTETPHICVSECLATEF
jgi:HD-GYP domain-containing protein (c-di-GMP phosphodiesterase class II)